jgi:hypothetical protein
MGCLQRITVEVRLALGLERKLEVLRGLRRDANGCNKVCRDAVRRPQGLTPVSYASPLIKQGDW